MHNEPTSRPVTNSEPPVDYFSGTAHTVTVIIPTYNCASFLPDAIESVLAQSLQDFEIVVVDDGSTDETRRVLESYAFDPRIHYVYQDNRGAPAARNRGVLEAKGQYIAALDADDTLEGVALEVMMNAVRRTDASWCVVDVVKFWEDHTEIRRTNIPDRDLLHAILRNDFICCGMFFRRSALLRLGMWDERLRCREDWDLNIRMIEAGEPVVYVPQPLYRYRKRPDSLTTSHLDHILRYTELLLVKHHARLARAGDREAAHVYAEQLWALGRRYFHESISVRAALCCALRSVRYGLRWRRLLHPVYHALVNRVEGRTVRPDL